MAGIFANVDSDINKLRQLKAEIENIKKALKSINVKVDIDIAKGMEAQLKSFMGQYDALVKKVSEAEGKIIISSKKASESYIKQQKDIDGLIQKYEELSRIINQIPSQPPQTPSPTKPSSGGRPRGPKTYTDAEIDAALNTQVNSIKAAREQLKVLRFAVAEVTDEEEKSNRTRTKLNAKIQENTQYLKENSDAYTKQKMNIGSYEQDIRKALKGNESLNISFSKLLATVGGIAVFKQLATEIVTVRGQFQQLEIAFSTMLKSKEKADKLMAELVDIAAKTPFDLQGVASSAKQMLAYGSQAENVGDELIMLGNVAAGVGAQLSEIAYLYGTLRTQGRAYAVDIRQFAGRGIPIYEELAKVLGVTKDEVAGFVTAGKVGFKEVEQAFKNMTSESGIYYNLMQEQSKSLTGQISNLGDAWDTMLNNIGKGTQGIASAGISGLKYLVENYENVGKILVSLVAAYGAYRTAIMLSTVAASKHTLAEIALINVRVLARNAQLALNAAMLTNPYVVIATAIGGLVAALFMFTKTTKSVEDVLTDLDNATNNFSKNVNNVDTLISEYEQLSTKTNRTKDENDRLNTVMNTLASTVNNVGAKFDEYGNIIDVNIEKVKEFSEAQKEALRIDLTASISKAKESVKKIDKDILAQQRIFKEGIYTKTRWVGAQFYGSYEEFESPATEEQKTEAAKKVNELYAKRSELIDKITSAEKVLSGISVEETTETIGEASVSKISSEIEQITERIKILNQEISDLRSGRMQVKVGETVESVIEAKEKELQNAEKTLEALTGVSNKTVSQGNSVSSTGTKISDLQRKQALDRAREAVDMENQIEQARIDAMADGGDKILAQRELNNKKEMQAIDRAKEEYIQKEIQRQKEIFEATEDLKAKKNPKYKRRSFDSSSVTVDTSSFDILKENTYKRQVQEDLNAQREAMNAYLAEYGTYMQKRQAIIEQYQDKINKATTEGEKLSLGKQRDSILSDLDEQANKTTSTVSLLFGDMKDKTLKDLEAINIAGQKALEFLKSGQWDETTGKELGITKENFDVWSNDPEKIKAISDALVNNRKAADDLQPAYKKVAAGIKDAFDAGNDSKKLEEALARIRDGMNEIMQVGSFLSDTFSSLGDAFGNDTFTGIADGINVAMDAMNSAMQGAQAGSMFGPIGAAAGAAIGVVTSLATSIAKIHDSKNEKNIEKLQDQIDVLDDSYNKLARSIEKAYSTDASDLIDQQNELLEQQKLLIQQQILEEKDKKKTDAGRIKEWEQQLKDIDEQILDNVEKAQEAIAGISFDSFRNNFLDSLSDMDAKVEGLADDFEEYLKKAILNGLMADKYDSQIKELYEKWTAYGKDGLTEAEVEQLRKDYKDIASAMIADRDNLAQIYGWESESSKEQQSASSRGFGSEMTHEDAGELSGRFTAVYESNLRIEMATQQQTMAITELKGPITAFNETSKGLYNIADETRTILANSYLELQQIRENTGEIIKPIKQMQLDIAEVKQNTSRL